MAAFLVNGNLENAALRPKFDVTELGELVFQYLPERFVSETSTREPPEALPEWFRFEIQSHDRSKYPFYVADAISSAHPTFGIDTFISESAKDKLTPILGDECSFLPVPIENAPEPYFAMWVKPLIPALDRSKARLTELSYLQKKRGKTPLRIDTFVFKDELLERRYLFRLPGLDYAEESLKDFATSSFVELAQDLKISGFTYFKAITVPAFSPQVL